MDPEKTSTAMKMRARLLKQDIDEYLKMLSSSDYKGIREKLFPKINPNSIFVFGNQKSGTSAIAALLAEYAGLSLTLDIGNFTTKEQEYLHNGRLTFENFVAKHKYEFSKQIIKEPALTFLYEDVKKVYKFSQAIIIIRDPRDNIRSILNRVNIPGHLDQLDNLSDLPKSWQMIINNRWMGLEYEHYIDSLSARWNKATDIFFNNKDDFILIRYEYFLAEKTQSISNIANQLHLTQVRDISNIVDYQYQPRGNRNVSWDEFFGEQNLMRIEQLCGSRMQLLGYKPKN